MSATEGKGGRVRAAEIWAPYMHRAKTHAAARHDLTGSNLFPLEVEELTGATEALRLHGPNDEGYAPWVEAIATRYGVETDRVSTAPGTSGANFLVMAALLRPGDEVLVERPTYDPLLGAARLLGAEIRRFDRPFEAGFLPDPDAVSAAATPRTRLIILSNLHNPSGVRVPEPMLREIGRLAERIGAHVLVDEVYLETDFASPSRPAAAISDVFISTNSLTKAFGLSGLRAGWTLAAPRVTEAIRRTRDVVDAVGAFPAETLAALAFRQIDDLLERARRILEPNLRALRALLARSEALEWVEPAGGPGGFPRLRGEEDSEPFVRFLEREFETSVVPGRFFESPAHFRIAIGGRSDRVADALDALERGIAHWRA